MSAFNNEIFVATFLGPEPGVGFVRHKDWHAKINQPKKMLSLCVFFFAKYFKDYNNIR